MPSYEKRGDTWCYRFREIIDGKEANRRVGGFKTKKEAKEAYEEYISAHIVQKTKKAPNPADDFGTLTALYLANQKTRLKSSSFYDTENKIKNHILPAFGQRKTTDIKPAEILEWQNLLAAKKYSYKYRNNIRAYLGAIFSFGERYYDTPNPMKKVEPIRNLEAKEEMQFWTLEEFKQFIEKADEPVYHAFFSLLYFSGCRKGEALALSFGDISDASISINKSVTRKTEELFEITTPKNNASVRTAVIPKALAQEIKNLPQNGNFVFGGDRPLPDRTIDRKFKKYCRRSGVKQIRIHDLRHSCASFLICEGNLSIVAVSKQLGHSDTQQTLNTYAHLMPSEEQKMQSVMDRAFSS